MNRSRVLVGILYSGENEFENCLAALKGQTHKNFDFHIIENLPNKEAHDALYTSFMNNSKAYDFFLKLDADMVFHDNCSLEKMIGEFTSNVAHLFAYVLDIPSSINIPAVQMFASDTRWTFTAEALNVDYPPIISGVMKSVWDKHFINHMPAPSEYQLFRYGIHKALKSIQPNREKKDVNKALLHISVLNGIARNFFSGREELLWSLIGATLVYSARFRSIHYNSEESKRLYELLKRDQSLYRDAKIQAQGAWKNEIQSLFRWWHMLNTTVWR